MLKKIISGGQTGIDTIALIEAYSLGFETGGTAPLEFVTEQGANRSLTSYGLKEISAEDKNYYDDLTGRTDRYTARTYVNTRDSDGTIYLSTDNFSPGSKTTRKGCIFHKKPFLMNPNLDSLYQWIENNNIETLNVAGNRASKLSKADASRFTTFIRTFLSHYIDKN